LVARGAFLPRAAVLRRLQDRHHPQGHPPRVRRSQSGWRRT